MKPIAQQIIEKTHRHHRDEPEQHRREPFRRHEPSHHDIERRAYELYEKRNGGDGSDVLDWLEAERELRLAAKGLAFDPDADI